MSFWDSITNGGLAGGAQQLAGGLGIIPKQIDPNAAGSFLDTANSDADRQQQAALINALMQQAQTGGGAWQQQLADAIKRGQSTAMAVGQSQPGVGYGTALQDIQNAQSAQKQAGAGQAAMLKAQSQLGAQDALSGILAGQSATDLSQAASSAQALQGVREANAALGQKAQQANLSMIPMIGQGMASASSMAAGGVVPHYDDGGSIGIGNAPGPTTGQAATWALVPGDFGNSYYNSLNSPQAASQQNGGLLNLGQFNQNRQRQQMLQAMLAQRAAGQGPSVAGQQLQNATDANIAAAMGGGPGAMTPGGQAQRAAAIGLTGAAGSQAADAAAGQKLREQLSGENVAGGQLQKMRAADLAQAQASQNAAWQNTELNAGITLNQIAQMRALMSGAGSAASTIAGMGGGPQAPSVGGYTEAQFNNSPAMSPDQFSSATSNSGDFNMPSESAGMAASKGGRVPGKAVFGGDDPRNDTEPALLSAGEIVLPRHIATAPDAPDKAKLFVQALKAKQGHAMADGGQADPGLMVSLQPPPPTMLPGLSVLLPKAPPPTMLPGFSVKLRPGEGPSPGAWQHAVDPARRGMVARQGPMLSRPTPGAGQTPEVDARELPGAVDLTKITNPEIQYQAFQDAVSKGQPYIDSKGMHDAQGNAMAMGGAVRGYSGADGSVVGALSEDPQVAAFKASSYAPQNASIAAPAASYQPPAITVAPPTAEQTASADMARPKTKSFTRDPIQGWHPWTAADEQAANNRPRQPQGPQFQMPQIPGGNVAGLAASGEEEKRGITLGAQTQAQLAADQEHILAEQRRQLNAENLADQQLRTKAAAEADSRMTQYQSALDDIRNQDMSIDPNRFWNSRSTGQKILAFIGMGLGSFSPDGINHAAQNLDRSVERDLGLQQEERKLRMAKGEKYAAGIHNMVDLAHQHFQDELTAQAAARQHAWEVVDNQLKQVAASSQGPMAQANAMQLRGVVDTKIAQARAAAGQQSFNNQLQVLRTGMTAGLPIMQEDAADKAAKEAFHEAAQVFGNGPSGERDRKINSAISIALAGMGARPRQSEIEKYYSNNFGSAERLKGIFGGGNPKAIEDQLYNEYLRNKAANPKTKLRYSDLPEGGEGG